MSREELEQEIRSRMYSANVESNEIEQDVCENCGNIIAENPHEEMIQEHGGTAEHRVTWCDKSCKSDWITDAL